MTFAQVILPLNLKGTFTYKIPDALADEVEEGKRVLIPFGGKKIYTGIVQSLHSNAPEGFIPKEIISVLDEVSLLPQEQLRFWEWLSGYYLCNIGEVYRFAFPASLKLESETYLKLRPNAEIDYQILEANEIFLIQALEVRQVINLKETEAFIPKKEIIKTVKSLIDLQYIEIDEKVSERYRAKEVAYIKIKEGILKGDLTQIFTNLKRSAKQRELLMHLLSLYSAAPEAPLRKSDVLEKGTFTPTHLKGLIEKGLVEEYYLTKDRLTFYEGEMEKVERLSPTQQRAKDEIDDAFANRQNVLLHGVTSSGKTHIFLQKIDEVVSKGGTALLLLPEVSLTKQMILRLEKKYGKALGYYHQKLTDFEKVEVWKKVKNNELSVVIGTRAALFLPFQSLGLIVVDEEHDSAFKPKEVSPFFYGRDAALYLSSLYNAPVILSSATPSVEAYYLSQIGKLKYVFIGERYAEVALPKMEVINYKEAQDLKNVSGNFSHQLLGEIKKVLDEKHQVMILHNKRGYSNVLECEACGYVAYCPNCDVVLTYHKASHEMKCHYCGNRAARPIACPKCKSKNLSERGIGVEKMYEEIQKHFPNAEVDRMDTDAMRRKFAYEKLYEKLEEGKTDILVGTQMIAKGLDFDNIELVAVPRADQMLHIQDFRAEERAYQLITQVSGRAGRKSGQGRIILQTFNPQQPIFRLINKSQPSEIYRYLLDERKKFHYPPYTKLVLIQLKHRKEDKLERAATFMGNILRKYLPSECVFGPEKPPISRINTYYHYQIMLKLPRGKSYKRYKQFIEHSLHEFDQVKAYHSIKQTVFVDP